MTQDYNESLIKSLIKVLYNTDWVVAYVVYLILQTSNYTVNVKEFCEGFSKLLQLEFRPVPKEANVKRVYLYWNSY